MGRNYTCNDCGLVAFYPAKGCCIACGSADLAETKAPKSATCILCHKPFKPRDSRQKACAVCVPRYRALKQAEMARKRYANGTGGHRSEPYAGPKERVCRPWQWLEGCMDERGRMSCKREILHTLEDKSAAGEWPWQDPLAGVGPSPIDECQFCDPRASWRTKGAEVVSWCAETVYKALKRVYGRNAV